MIYKKLRELRKRSGIFQSVLADLLGVTREGYSLYETGKREIGLASLCKIADFYNVSTDYLLGRSEMCLLCEENDHFDLSKKEELMLIKYRSLSDRAKGSVENCLSFEYNREMRRLV